MPLQLIIKLTAKTNTAQNNGKIAVLKSRRKANLKNLAQNKVHKPSTITSAKIANIRDAVRLSVNEKKKFSR
jgi:hypothetical protein